MKTGRERGERLSIWPYFGAGFLPSDWRKKREKEGKKKQGDNQRKIRERKGRRRRRIRYWADFFNILLMQFF